MADQTPSPEWLQQLDDLLGIINAADSSSGSETKLATSLAGLEPALVEYLLQQVVAQGTPEAAAFLEIVATQNGVSEAAHTQARAALTQLGQTGVTVTAPESERFLAGYVQGSRERGEQILILGWCLASGEIEALVFLLDWRGDGLRDYYVTHPLSDAQWGELIEHNAEKGAPLTELSLAEARALLDASLAESRRFSRPLPREYKIAPGLVEKRILRADLPPVKASRSFITPDLAPDDIVTAYIAALSYRDYNLAVELLTERHPSRAGRTVMEAAEALRVESKHAPRREEAVEIAPAEAPAGGKARSVLDAAGAQIAVQPSGKRVRAEVHERYTLRLTEVGWRIEQVERLS